MQQLSLLGPENLVTKCFAPIMDMTDQKARADAEPGDALDLFVMQDGTARIIEVRILLDDSASAASLTNLQVDVVIQP